MADWSVKRSDDDHEVPDNQTKLELSLNRQVEIDPNVEVDEEGTGAAIEWPNEWSYLDLWCFRWFI